MSIHIGASSDGAKETRCLASADQLEIRCRTKHFRGPRYADDVEPSLALADFVEKKTKDAVSPTGQGCNAQLKLLDRILFRGPRLKGTQGRIRVGVQYEE